MPRAIFSAVIADLADDAGGPCRIELEVGAHLALDAEESADLWATGGIAEARNIGRRHAKLLRVDHGEQRPADDVEPFVTALAHHRAERLLGDYLGEHDMGVRVLEPDALGINAGLVGGVDVAAPGIVSGDHFVRFLERHRRIGMRWVRK